MRYNLDWRHTLLAYTDQAGFCATLSFGCFHHACLLPLENTQSTSLPAALKFWRRKADKCSSGHSSTEEDSVTTSSTSSSFAEETDEMTPLKARQWFKTSFPNKDAQRRSEGYLIDAGSKLKSSHL